MRILVTGNMGYVGSVVVATMKEMLPGAAVAGYDSGFFAGCLVDPSMFPERLLEKQWFGDVRRFDGAILRGVDAVVHLAAVSNDPMGKAFEQVTWDVNCGATLEIARRARENGVGRFVFASSCSLYGAGGTEARTEESPVAPLTAYARSKVGAEEGLRELADGNFRVTCLRFATACGASPRLRLDLVLNDFVASAIATGVIKILSDGTPWRPLIHVEDMARAIVWGMERGGVEGSFLTVNVGSARWNYQILELARAVQKELAGVEIDLNSNAAPDRRSYRVDFSRFQSLAPDHQPRAELHMVVRELADSLRATGFRDAEFRSSRWMRLKVLESLVASGRISSELYWR